MSTLDIILAELGRQHEESRAHGLAWFDTEDPRQASIDGQVDLVALAEAIDAGRRGSFIDPNTTAAEIGSIRNSKEMADGDT